MPKTCQRGDTSNGRLHNRRLTEVEETSMRTALGLVVVLALVAATAFVTGCSSGGGSGPVVGPQGNTITGKVDTAGGAAYDVLLDGKPVPGAMRANGTYVIEGVPPGDHRVAVIEQGTSSGGYVSVEVRDGRDATAPDITPELGGQIVGMVTTDDDGGIRALGGVEVIAVRSDMMITMSTPAQDDAALSVYPPPPLPLPEFSAFTEDDGSYRIPAVPEGEYTVTVALPDYEQGWQWGRVVGTGTGHLMPVEGAMVTISSDVPWRPIGPICPPGGGCVGGDPGEGDDTVVSGKPDAPAPPENIDSMPPPWFTGVSTLTDADGRYSLNAPAGYASIDVWAPDFEPAWGEITIEANQTQTRNFELKKWQEIPYPDPPPPGPGPEPQPLAPGEG